MRRKFQKGSSLPLIYFLTFSGLFRNVLGPRLGSHTENGKTIEKKKELKNSNRSRTEEEKEGKKGNERITNQKEKKSKIKTLTLFF